MKKISISHILVVKLLEIAYIFLTIEEVWSICMESYTLHVRGEFATMRMER